MSQLQTIHTAPASTLLLIPLATGVAIFFIVLALLWHDAVYFPLPPGGLSEHLRYWLLGLASNLSQGQAGAQSWSQYRVWFDVLPSGQYWGFFIRLALALIAGTGIATLTLLHLLQDREDKPLRGRTLRQGKSGMRQLKAEATKEFNSETAGIFLHPEVQISQPRETKHMLIMGASGTHAMNPALYPNVGYDADKRNCYLVGSVTACWEAVQVLKPMGVAVIRCPCSLCRPTILASAARPSKPPCMCQRPRSRCFLTMCVWVQKPWWARCFCQAARVRCKSKCSLAPGARGL